MSATTESTAAMTAATLPESESSARVAVSVINMKGGVGKTTIATLLCRHFARTHKVLAIDLDPQANMSQALMGGTGYRRFLQDRSPSVVDVFKEFSASGQRAFPDAVGSR